MKLGTNTHRPLALSLSLAALIGCGGDDDSDVNPTGEIQCPDGSSFVRFNLDRSDLIDANNPSCGAGVPAQATASLTVLP